MQGSRVLDGVSGTGDEFLLGKLFFLSRKLFK
jgi:hypothetical protein